MQRTIRVQLEPTERQALLLKETQRQFTLVFNHVAALGWTTKNKNGVELHHATYYPLRAELSELPSDYHIQARMRATEAVKSALALAKDPDRMVTQPTSLVCPPRCTKNAYRVDWESRTLRLTAIGGRQTLRFNLPRYYERYLGPDTETDAADLVQRRNGTWWLHIVVTVPTPDIVPSDAVVGVDLGLAQAAVTSTNLFLGQRRWKAIEGRRFNLRRALQQRKTRSARRHLRRLRGKTRRFRRDCDHGLSKRIVDATPEGGAIVLENLKDIRKRSTIKRPKQARRVHSWTFAQLKSFVEYKAEARGCTVAVVDPRYTSQQCSRCGHTTAANRRSRGRFVCHACGFDLHADLNASRNIAARYHASVGTPDAGGLSVNQPIASVPPGQMQAASL